MKRMKRITLLLTLAAALCAAASCVENLGVDGGAVNFGATMGGALTKTAYSGTVTGNKEAIHWVSSDQILILCEQANGDKSKAYGITPNTSDRTKADKVTPVGGKGLQWGTGPHYFHAAYPSTVSLSSASSPEHSSIFTASIPDGQGGEWKGKEYEPNMSYAYMYAATSSAADAAQVNLTFKPLMTAFRFEIKSDPTDPLPAGTKLTKVELSASTNLAGEFTAVIAPDGTLSGPVSVTPFSAKQSLSINLGSTGVELDENPRAFTFFALPVEQKELTLKLTFNDGGDEFTRSLALKNSGAWITVAACTKLRISGLGVTPSGITGWASEPYNPGGDPGIVEVKSNYLPGVFSVSETEKVYFSKGNLQVNYTGTSTAPGYTREWLFSENQWDVFYPTADELRSLPNPPEGTTVKLSHFGWATAGHERTDSGGNGLGYGYDSPHTSFEPHSTSFSTPSYGPSRSFWMIFAVSGYSKSWNSVLVGGVSPANEARSYCDWGIHFDTDGVGYDDKYDGTWFTLSREQWKYLFDQRLSFDQRRGLAHIDINPDPAQETFVVGLVLLPDDWQCPDGCSFTPGSTYSQYITNNFYDVATDWPLMEASGAVFLPATGRRVWMTGAADPGWPYQEDPHAVSVGINSNVAGYYWTSELFRLEDENFAREADVAGFAPPFSILADGGVGFKILSTSYGHSVRLVRSANQTP